MKQKGRIQVSTEMEWKHQRVRITVADEGPGIRQEDQVKLFVPYFRKTGEAPDWDWRLFIAL